MCEPLTSTNINAKPQGPWGPLGGRRVARSVCCCAASHTSRTPMAHLRRITGATLGLQRAPQWPKERRRVRFPHCANDDLLLSFCGSQSTPEADLTRHLRVSAPARSSSSWQGPCWCYWESPAPVGQERWGHCSQWFLVDADSHVQTSESISEWTWKGWRIGFVFWIGFGILFGHFSWYHYHVPCIGNSLELDWNLSFCMVFATFWHVHPRWQLNIIYIGIHSYRDHGCREHKSSSDKVDPQYLNPLVNRRSNSETQLFPKLYTIFAIFLAFQPFILHCICYMLVFLKGSSGCHLGSLWDIFMVFFRVSFAIS